MSKPKTMKERLARLLKPVPVPEKRSMSVSDVLWGGRSHSTMSGVSVTEKSALNVIEVLTAIRVISNGFAQVPLKVYRTTAKGREEARDHPLYRLLHERPNKEMTSFSLRQAMMGHLLTYGNTYCELERNFHNEVIGIWPLLPDRVTVKRDNSGELFYEVRTESRNTVTLPAKDVLHIPGLSFDGLKGYSPIQLMRENIGVASAYQEMSARFFSNDATPGFVLSTDRILTEPSFQRLQTQYNEAHQGLRNKFKPVIMDDGLKPVDVQMSLEDAQFIQSRQYERWAILGYFGIPPHMVGDVEKSTSWGSGISEMSVGFIKFVMDPWFLSAEQVINAKLFGQNAQGPLTAEFDREGFLRGDTKTRHESYKSALGGATWQTVNEIRKLENLPTIGPEGDLFLVPSNMVPADQLKEKIQKEIDKSDVAPLAIAEKTPDKSDKGEDRAALMRAQKHNLVDVVDRILRRERADVSRNVSRLLSKPDEFGVWLDTFYKDHRVFSRKALGPGIQSFADTIRADVQRELGKEVPPLGSFVRSLTDSVAARVATAGEADLRKQIISAAEPTWSRAAEEVVERELVQIGNALTKAAYRAAGETLFRWVARDSCEECRVLDGQLLSIDHKHPPLCDDCSCVIVADRSTGGTNGGTGQNIVVNVSPQAPATPAPQSHTYHLTIPERSVTVTNEAPPAQNPQPITIQVNPTPITNEVNLPPMEVTNQVNPTPIEVNNLVPVPTVTVEQPKKSARIKRDKAGLIVGVDQVDDEGK